MSIPTARLLHRSGSLPNARPGDTITLDYEGRFLRRRRLTTDSGANILIDLVETVSLNAGDALETSDGMFIAVCAAPEPLMEIRATGAALARLAWHVGNRHTPAQVEEGRLLIRFDRIMGDMLNRLGAQITEIKGTFTPEGGAYGHGRTHGHHHGPADSDPNGHESHSHHHHHEPSLASRQSDADDRDYDHTPHP